METRLEIATLIFAEFMAKKNPLDNIREDQLEETAKKALRAADKLIEVSELDLSKKK